ncbi:hypothetical protein CRG98_047247 [Punica granatum]|nr:hypothetical protein CRG98_047247 [Punica granatum]
MPSRYLLAVAAPSSLFPALSFDSHGQLSNQTLFPRGSGQGFVRASRNLKVYRLKANFWDTIRSG